VKDPKVGEVRKDRKQKKILVKSFTNSDEFETHRYGTQDDKAPFYPPSPNFRLYQLFPYFAPKFIIRLSDPACRQAVSRLSDYTHEPVPTKKRWKYSLLTFAVGNCQCSLLYTQYLVRNIAKSERTRAQVLGHEYETGAGIGRQ